jgi:FHIPEP family
MLRNGGGGVTALPELNKGSVLSLVIEPGSALSALAESEVFARDLENEAAVEFNIALEKLGLGPGSEVCVRFRNSDQWLRLSLEERQLVFPKALPVQLWRALTMDDNVGIDGIIQALNEKLASHDTEQRRVVIRFLAGLAVEAAKLRPEHLLRRSDVERITRVLTERGLRSTMGEGPDLQLPLHELLGLGIACSPANEVLLEALSQLAPWAGPVDEFVEWLITTLRPQRIEVRVQRDYLEELLNRDIEIPLMLESATDSAPEATKQLAERLFNEMGLRLPPVVLAPADELPPRCCRVSIADLPGPLVALPPPDRALVNALGLPFEYLVLVLEAQIRAAAPRLVDLEAVEYELAEHYQVFPALVDAALGSLRLPQLTSVIRGLLREGLSVRNLRVILERMMAFTAVSAPTADRLCLDDRLLLDERVFPHAVDTPEARLQFVRIGLRHAISARCGQDHTISAFLLTRELENNIVEHLASLSRDSTPLPNGTQLDTLRDTISHEMTVEEHSVLLTSSSLRLWFYNLLRDGLPRVSVLAREEVAPEWSLRTIKRIRPPAAWLATEVPSVPEPSMGATPNSK